MEGSGVSIGLLAIVGVAAGREAGGVQERVSRRLADSASTRERSPPVGKIDRDYGATMW